MIYGLLAVDLIDKSPVSARLGIAMTMRVRTHYALCAVDQENASAENSIAMQMFVELGKQPKWHSHIYIRLKYAKRWT